MPETADAGYPQTHISVEALRSREPKFSWKVWLAWFAVVTVAFFAILGSHPEFRDGDPLFLVVMAPSQGLLAATFYYGCYVWLRRWAFRSMLKRVAAETIEKRT